MSVRMESDNLLELVAFKNAASAAVIDGAEVSAEVFDKRSGGSLTADVTLADQGSGLYQGTLADAEVTAANGYSIGQRLEVVITADGGTGLLGVFRFAAVVVRA